MDLFNLMAKLSLDGKDFDKGMKNADKQGKNLANKLEKSFKTVQKVAKTVFAGYLTKTIVGTMKSLVMSTSQFGDVIDKQSQVLGLSRKAYQEWDYILGQNGASIDDMSMAMRTMNQLLANAGEDSQEAKDALAKLGVSMDLISSMPVEHQFNYLVQQFQKMPPSAEKSALAIKLFGRNGMTLLPLLNQSADSMAQLYANIEDYGLIMGDEAVDASVKFGDTLDDLKRTWKAFRNAIGAKPLNALTNGIQRATNYLAKLRKAYDQNGFKGVWQTLIGDLKDIWPSWSDVKDAASAAWDTIVKGVTEDLPALVFGRKDDGRVDWPTWNDVKQAAVDAWAKIKEGARNIGALIFGRNKDGKVAWPTWNDVKVAAGLAWTGIKQGARKIADTLGGLVFGRKKDGSVDWPDWNSVKKFAEEKWDDIKAGALTLAGLVFGKKDDGTVNWPNWDTLQGIAEDAWDAFKDVVGAFGGLIFGRDTDGNVKWPSWSDLEDVAIGLWNDFKDVIGALGGLIFGRDTDGNVKWPDWDTIKQTASDAWGDFVGYVAELPALIFGEGTVLGDGLTAALNLIKDVGSWVLENGEAVALGIAGIIGAFKLSKLVGLIAAHPVITALAALITAAAANQTGIDGISSVATAIETIGAAFVTYKLVEKVIELKNTFSNLFSGEGLTGAKKWELILAGIAALAVLIYENWDDISEWLSKAGTWINENIITPVSEFFEEIKTWITDNIVTPFEEAFESIKGFFDEYLIQPFRKFLKWLGIIGPDTVEEFEELNPGVRRSEFFLEQNKSVPKWLAAQEATADAMRNINNPYAILDVQNKLDELGEEISPEDFAELMAAANAETAATETLTQEFGSLAAATVAANKALLSLGRAGGGGEGAGASGSGFGSGGGGGGGSGGAQDYLDWLNWGNRGYNAKGMWTVPYDDYVTRLHRGERVLTASQARHGEGGVNTNEVVQAVKEAVSELVGSLTITLNKKIVGRVMGDTVSSRVHDNINFANDQRAYAHGR